MAAGLMLIISGILIQFLNFSTRVWHTSVAQSNSQGGAESAAERLGPLLRNARRVVVSSSNDHQLTIQEPAYDASGNMLLPLQDGDVYCFYLSDQTGSPSHTGTILWRSANGVPDRSWSLRNGQGRVFVAAGGLGFTYYPTAAPETVTVNLSAFGESGNRSSQFPVSEEFKLRNKDL